MELKEHIQRALEEDLGRGDITTEALFDASAPAKAKILAKQDLVLAGLDVAHKVFTHLDKKIIWKPEQKDGERVRAGEPVVRLEGKACAILKGERVALNFLQWLSGIATLTRRFVDTVEGTGVRILDTRKTTPTWRAIEKYAVQMGGGNNHRIGLFDRYLVKDNHITLAGSVASAIQKVLGQKKNGVPVEVEVQNLEELKEALKFPVDIILLDNFTPERAREAVLMGRDKVQFEASGGITLENVRAFAETGVDFISVGALTHSPPAADLSLTFLPS
ncbi:MAG: carboxylating nicotinate-nucleotide diphosphorylase [Deltaproteobacteria bacterium]|nr:carboxylating nicotinate-nucleotide diphosphorylase [Deltaproteobacteria bacterium]